MENVKILQVTTKNAQKPTRKIEVGWLHNGKQVRGINGGGNRKIGLPKEARNLGSYKKISSSQEEFQRKG